MPNALISVYFQVPACHRVTRKIYRARAIYTEQEPSFPSKVDLGKFLPLLT